MHPYIITLESHFSEFWRYNLIVQGEVMHRGTHSADVEYSSIVAPVGSNLKTPPTTYQRGETIVIETLKGDALGLYIYILPHTLPFSQRVADSQPFEFRVEIHQGKESIFKHRYEVDQWSGCNVEITL